MQIPNYVDPIIHEREVVGNGTDGINITQAQTDNLRVESTKVIVRADGRSGIMMVNTRPDLKRYPTHVDPIFRDLVIQAEPRTNTTKWGMRRYGLEGEHLTENCVIRNIGKEHAIYDELWGGNHVYKGLHLDNCGAQGLQVRLTEQPASLSPYWTTGREILVEDVAVTECGQVRGAGRAGFGVSIKDQGPNTSVILRNLFIQTVKQSAVKVKADGTVLADSFGALCVETVGDLLIEGGYINMKNPDRHAIQLFNSSAKGMQGGAPTYSIVIDGLHLENQVLVVRENGTKYINITNCKGSGQIRVMRFINGAWKFDEAIPWSKGYTFRA